MKIDARFLLLPDATLLQSVQAMTTAGHKILLVHGGDNRMLGIITDYDIRMAILKHMDFSTPVREFMKQNPVTVNDRMTDAEVLSALEDHKVQFAPVVDAKRRIIGIRFIDEFIRAHEAREELTAVIMAGGIGKRLHPITRSIPKPLLTVGGKPILFMLIDQLLTENIDRVYVSVNYMSEMIIEAVRHVARYRDKVDFLIEPSALGTAGALKLLPRRLNAPITVMNGDLLTNVSVTDMRLFHQREKNRITVALKKETYEIPYGVAKIEGSRLVGLEEKPHYTHFVNTGVYIIEPNTIDRIAPNEHVDMTDLIDTLLKSNERIGSFPIHEYWLDIGTPAHYEKAQRDYDKIAGNGNE